MTLLKNIPENLQYPQGNNEKVEKGKPLMVASKKKKNYS